MCKDKSFIRRMFFKYCSIINDIAMINTHTNKDIAFYKNKSKDELKKGYSIEGNKIKRIGNPFAIINHKNKFMLKNSIKR